MNIGIEEQGAVVLLKTLVLYYPLDNKALERRSADKEIFPGQLLSLQSQACKTRYYRVSKLTTPGYYAPSSSNNTAAKLRYQVFELRASPSNNHPLWWTIL